MLLPLVGLIVLILLLTYEDKISLALEARRKRRATLKARASARRWSR